MEVFGGILKRETGTSKRALILNEFQDKSTLLPHEKSIFTLSFPSIDSKLTTIDSKLTRILTQIYFNSWENGS